MACWCRKNKEASQSDFGSHDIGVVGSITLLINNITGAGMTTLPGLYQKAGII